MALLQKKDPNEVIKCVNCPFKALKADGDNFICDYGPKFHHSTIGPVNLGSIKQEVIDHCGSCAYKKQKPEDKKKMAQPVSKPIALTEFQQVKCPELKGQEVSIKETCKGCLFCDKERMKKELMENNGAEVKNIYCYYPNLPDKALKAFLSEKTKKQIAEAKKKGEVLI